MRREDREAGRDTVGKVGRERETGTKKGKSGRKKMNLNNFFQSFGIRDEHEHV